ncbi:hypothetical protein PRK78_005241 [Emydomyces testavorans]|uniref:Uncharacterized protein n=1 Tax=Emydomyces testavorans TaxID=2070801 RepID=A0AAF0DJ97_9EURO|nr:hypothetical protein PRK78_005241 [Emydomyces testavorans]
MHFKGLLALLCAGLAASAAIDPKARAGIEERQDTMPVFPPLPPAPELPTTLPLSTTTSTTTDPTTDPGTPTAFAQFPTPNGGFPTSWLFPFPTGFPSFPFPSFPCPSKSSSVASSPTRAAPTPTLTVV